WDRSPRMRALAAANTAACANACVLEAEPADGRGGAPFDLVLLNSVLQYVGDEDVGGLLAGIRPLLSAGGAIVVSDVVTIESKLRLEIGQLLRFGFQQGVLGDL